MRPGRAPKKSRPAKKRTSVKKKSGAQSRGAAPITRRRPAPGLTTVAASSAATGVEGSTALRELDAIAPAEAPVVTGAEVEGVILTFTKDDNSPEDVRVTLQEPEDCALAWGDKTGKSQPRNPGKVKALVEVRVPAPTGGKRTATISVTNVTASPIVATVADGKSSFEGVVRLTVVEEKKT